MKEAIKAAEGTFAKLGKQDAMIEALSAQGQYHVECHDAAGNLVWKKEIKNLVTTEGKDSILDNHFSGSLYTAQWYIGLIGATGYTGVAVTDTAAAHAGWTEDVDYSQATRPTTAWSGAAAGSKTLSAGCVYTMTAATTIKGCFLVSAPNKGDTTGVLYSAGLFTGGDQPVTSGNTLTVTYTASV